MPLTACPSRPSGRPRLSSGVGAPAAIRPGVSSALPTAGSLDLPSFGATVDHRAGAGGSAQQRGEQRHHARASSETGPALRAVSTGADSAPRGIDRPRPQVPQRPGACSCELGSGAGPRETSSRMAAKKSQHWTNFELLAATSILNCENTNNNGTLHQTCNLDLRVWSTTLHATNE